MHDDSKLFIHHFPGIKQMERRGTEPSWRKTFYFVPCRNDLGPVPRIRRVKAQLRRIYPTFNLGTALQNFGTRANNIGHGPLNLYGKISSTFFNVDFWNGTPETRTALLNL